MSRIRSRAAASPLHRFRTGNALASVDEIVAAQHPEEPVYCLRPRTIAATSRHFLRGFAGDVLYAVKCNPEPAVLRALWRGGVRHFDCASIAEIRLVRQMFAEAAIHYMHPIKPAGAIREAYERHGVRDFSYDSAEEIDKILAATDDAGDLGLHLRLAVPKGQVSHDLSGKFGASAEAAPALLRRAAAVSARVGVCFHVGSQCLDPSAYERALDLATAVAAAASVRLDIVDVGGGFPVSYPDMTPPSLDAYFAAIERGFARLRETGARLWCEPGRVLVAGGASVVVRVEARRGDTLYINDGVYGTLSDAGVPRLRFPARVVGRGSALHMRGETRGFAFYGPTCDSADFMSGPFLLPEDIGPGEWIELGQLGAYGACLRTGFNGFERVHVAEVADPPLLVTPGLPHPALAYPIAA